MCTIGEKDYDFRKPVLHTPSAHTDAFLGLSSKGSLGREDLSLGLERPRQLSTPNYRGALAPLTVKAGMARAKAQGKRTSRPPISEATKRKIAELHE
jgi:hypothetical protein